MNTLCLLLVLVVSQAPLVEAPSDDVYDTILVDIDVGNTELTQALQRGDRRAEVGALLAAQQQRFRDRSVLAGRLSESRQQRNATLSPATFEEVRRDGAFLLLWTTATVVVTIPDQLERLQRGSAADIASLVAHALAMAALVAVTVFVARAGTSALQRGRLWVARQQGDRAVLTAGTHAFTIAAHLLSPLIGVIAVAGISSILDDVDDNAAVVLLLHALHVVVWARVVVAAVVLVIEALASTPLGGLSPSLLSRVRTQVTSVGRTVVGGWLVAVWCEVVLVDGAVVALARMATVVAVVVALVAVVAHFRDEIAERYLELQPQGSLADAVKAQRTRTFGFAVAAAALVVVALQAVVGSMQRFLLGFAETRRALAYVFRRRLERDAQQRQTPTARPLPLVVVNALSDAPEDADDELAAISTRFADDLTRLERSVAMWREHRDRVGASVLVGLPGHGKSTWLQCALARLATTDLPVTRVPLRGRLRSRPALFRTLASALSLPASDDTLDELVAALRRRDTAHLIIVDDLQNLLLRGDPSRVVWRAFEEFIQAAAPWVYVIATIDALAEQHLRWSNVDVGHVFRERFVLAPWSDADIEVLLRRRIARTGFRVHYDELLVATVDGVEREARVLATAREYARLIWDFAEGCPAVALDAWRRSLHLQDDATLQVRLFKQPDEQVLETSSESARFVLAAVAWNENVTAEEAARGLGMADDIVVNLLERFREHGVLVCEHQRYRIATPWWSVVWRFLRRKHLITLSPATA